MNRLAHGWMLAAWAMIAVAALGGRTHAACAMGEHARLSACAAADKSELERWDGDITVGATKLNIALRLTRGQSPSAKLEIPTQGLPPTPVKDLTIDGDKVSFTLAIASMPASAHPRFELELDASKGEGHGTMFQSGMKMPVTLRLLKDGEAGGPKRSQNPVGPLPYTSRDVVYDNAESGGKLAGTLTIPEEAKFGAGPFPAVILITGSGAQDRDESLLGHKPFLVIADDLTRRGVAVLRVDDRGIGGSTSPKEGKETTDDFVTDVLAGFEFLKTQKNIDPKRVGLIGHSEGGVIAPMAAARNADIAAIALLAGTGVPGRDVLEIQMVAMLKSQGVGTEAIDQVSEAQKRVLELAAGHADDKTLDEAIRALVKAQTGNESDEGVARAKATMATPWMRRFLVLDPKQAIAQVRCPVLVMNGGLDRQVDAKQNVPAIVDTLLEHGNFDVTVHVFPKLNHLFQTARTGSVMEYGQLDETFAPEALDVLGRWISSKLAAGVPAAK